MNPHVRLPLLGLFGLALLAPLSVSRAEFTLIVETPILGRYSSGFSHDFWGPGERGVYLRFDVEDDYSGTYRYQPYEYTSYFGVFNVARWDAEGNGASFSSTSSSGSIRGSKEWGSNTWTYNFEFNMSVGDPIAANAKGSTSFSNPGGSPDPLFKTYSMAADPYFDNLAAGVSIEYTNVTQKPEDFLKSFFTIGSKDESNISWFHAYVSSSRSTGDDSSFTAYDGSYAAYEEESRFTILVTVVPEPSTYGIAGVGLIALAGLGRGLRGRRRAA